MPPVGLQHLPDEPRLLVAALLPAVALGPLLQRSDVVLDLELVEVAVRSLSPGINDPFTAVNCVDRLGAALAQLVQRDFPSPYRYGQDERLRLIAKPFDFVGALDAAINQIRQYGSTSVAVTVRLLEALHHVAKMASSEEQQRAIRRQADMILRGAEHSLPEQEDQTCIRQVHQELCETLSDS